MIYNLKHASIMVINNIYLPNFWQRNVASAVKKKSENISIY